MPRLKPLLFLAAAAPALLAAGARAAPAGDVSEVVITAAPFAVSIDSATTHTDILDRARIDAAPAAGLGDMLNGLPGVRSTANGPGASRPVVRGLSGPRVLVLENGVGMVDASTLSPDHAVASDPGQANRIEVLRGPSTLAYGGSGIGGVVNVLDSRVPSSLPEPVSGRLSASGASVDRSWATSGRLTAAFGRIAVTVDGSKRESNDYAVPVNPVSARLAAREGLVPAPDRKLRNAAVDTEAYGVGASYVGQGGDYLGLSLKRTGTDYGVPYAQLIAGPDQEGPVRIRLRQTRWDLRGQKRIGAGPFETARLSAGYADYNHAEIDAETGAVGTRFFSKGGEARLELVQREHGGWQGALGLQGLARSFRAVGDEAFVPPARIREAGAFTLQRLDQGGWGVEGGLRLDRRAIEAPSVGGDRAFTNFSGSLGAFWRPAALPGGFLGLSVSRNGRAPTEFELFANGPHPGTGAFEVGDARLGSERVLSAELTGRMSGRIGRLEAHLYAARYHGYIEEAPTGAQEDGLPVYRFSQTGARFRGAEVEAELNLISRPSGSLALEGTYDVVRGETGGGAPARIPPWSLTGALVWTGPALGARAELRHVAAQTRVAAVELPTDGYTTLGLELSWRPLADRDWRLLLQGRNLTDVEAREHASFLKDIAPQPGRSVRLGTTWSF